MFAAVPYVAYLFVVWRFVRRKSERAYRCVALLAPIVVGSAFAVIAAAVEAMQRQNLTATDLAWGLLVLFRLS